MRNINNSLYMHQEEIRIILLPLVVSCGQICDLQVTKSVQEVTDMHPRIVV